MCSRARCRSCGLTTWSGCGAHVDRVMRGVPQDQRCTCEDGRGTTAGAGTTVRRRSFLSRLRGG